MLLRHGRTADNASGRIQGHLDTPLDDVGHEQSRDVAPLLAALRPAVVLSSDLVRARDTAAPLAALAGCRVRTDPRLRELFLGGWQGLTADEARERFPAEHDAWRAGVDVARGGGETYADAGARAVAGLLAALPDVPAGRTLVAVTHGGTARGALGTLLEEPVERWWRLAPLGNTCWSVLVEDPRGWRLERHGVHATSVPGAADGSALPAARARPVG